MAWKIGLWVTRILGTVLLACMLSIWTTSYVVTSYVQALLQQYEIPLEVKPVALADVLGMLWGAEQEAADTAIVETEADDSDSKLADADAENLLKQQDQSQLSQSGSSQEGSDLTAETGASEQGQVLEGEGDQQAVAELDDSGVDANAETDDFTQPSQEVLAPIESGSQPTITPDEIDASKENMAAEDKERMFELIMDKLPPQSWQVFSSYIEDGLTDQELLEIQQMMAQHLTKDEYSELMELLAKY